MARRHKCRLKYLFPTMGLRPDTRALAFKCVGPGCPRPGLRLYSADKVYAAIRGKTV